MTTLQIISAEGFNIEDYNPGMAPNDTELAARNAFWQSVADLKNDVGYEGFSPFVKCIINCIQTYLACGGGTSFCWLMFENCVGQCGGQMS